MHDLLDGHPTMSGRAALSSDLRYRYTLERAWSSLPRYVLWLMMNPSTADAATNDATIRRCIGYARAWGYTGILVGNLYAYRATDPRALYAAHSCGEDVIGPDNETALRALIHRASLIVCAWGRTGPDQQASFKLKQLLRHHQVHALKFNQDGEPSHPLRLSAKLRATRWGLFDDLGNGHGG